MAFYLKIGDPDYMYGFDIVRKYETKAERDAVLEESFLRTLNNWKTNNNKPTFKATFEWAASNHFAAYFCWENNQERKRKIFVDDEIPGTNGAKASFAAMIGNLHILAWEDDKALGLFICNCWVKDNYVYLAQGNWEDPWEKVYEQNVPTKNIFIIEKYIRSHFHSAGRWRCTLEEFKSLIFLEYSNFMLFKEMIRKEE